ncbi:MAG: hypothetical protein WBC91_18030 [Phototrophicaceae bacterium]
MVDYFTEVFPIGIEHIGQLTAYDIEMSKGVVDAIIQDFLARLTKTFSGHWVWDGSHIITDNAPSPVQLDITLDVLRKEFPARFGQIKAINERTDWFPTAEDAANFIAQLCVMVHDAPIRQKLRSHGVRIRNAYVMRDYLLQGWEVDGHPALSFTLKSRLLYLQNVQATLEQGYDVLGLQVIDKTNGQNIGVIQAVEDTVATQRDGLLQSTLSAEMQALITDADDTIKVVSVSFGTYQRHYIASALNIILTATNYEQFGIGAPSITKAMLLKPDEMAQIVSEASDTLKELGIIGNAYNNRVNAQHFIYLDHVPEMEFGAKHVRPYKLDRLITDFIKHGLFGQHPRFKDTPIRIAVINTLEDNLAIDFVEAMRRQLEKDFGMNVELIKERSVRVVSNKNLASAIRVLEKENPHVLLACFADDQTASYDYVHSLTLGKGIALQALYEKTMHNPDAMGWVMMGILAKTGNTPYVLADPFESTNLVVGLDWVREHLTRGDRVVGMARIYRRDGYFMRYFMDIQELETDAAPPLTMIQSLFPAPIFTGKRVIIHHQGTIPDPLLRALDQWQSQINAQFLLIEIHTEHVPHVYALQSGISQAPWGSVYLLNQAEAFVVSSSPDETMPESIHIRIRFGDLTIEQAIYSVLALTLLSYGTSQMPRLPITIQNGDKLAEWLGRGMLPNNVNGDIAFWL